MTHNDTMDLQKMVPLVIYDNKCYLCIRFTRVVSFLSRGRLLLVGHYTDLGEKLRNQILDSSALEMFWFVDGKTAYGGRAALVPMFCAIIRATRAKSELKKAEACETGCKTAKAVFLRSASLLLNSKKIPIDS
jgi:predicted DCC family thiol-disulfide oxidoreductase YuxK